MVMAAGLLTACDPAKDDVSVPGNSITAEQLQDGFSFTQYGDEEYTTEAQDGNYFTFFTSPSRVVSIYQLDDEGNKNVLVSGVANGKFKIVPKRGNSTEQKFYVETLNFDGSTVVAERTANVYVPSDLTPEMRLLASDAYGKKIWKWDTEWREDGGAWGNVGYAAGSGADFALNGNGACWFGCAPADLVGQLEHSDTGVATGEEDPNAYMIFDWKTNAITSYDASGKQIRQGKYSITDWGMGKRTIASVDGGQQEWALGKIHIDAGAILFPFQINYNKEHHDGVRCPTDFEIMQLDADHLKLIYVSPGTGSWKEATWWAFKAKK